MKEFDKLVEIFKTLRGPEGCPWDREQTHDSILQCSVDEVYEFLEAVEDKDRKGMCEELGDLMLQVVFHSQMASENGDFNIRDVLNGINQKLINRHPHVFGDAAARNPDQVIENWEAIKDKEKKHRKSAIDGIPKHLPALFKAEKLQRKAGRVGFDWPEVGPVMDKVDEEIREFKDAIKSGDPEKIEDEFGDVLFALVNAGRHLNVSAEEALRKSVGKFVRRFSYIEKKVNGKKWEKFSLEELDQFWNEAKEMEKK